MKCFLSILIVFFVVEGLNGQEKYNFSYLTVEQGLTSNRVSDIFRDSKDYVWIGTYGGLNKYDGYGIKTYYYNKNKKHSISDNNITCIYEDSNNSLWIGTFNGLNLYRDDKDSFEVFLNNENQSSISSNYISKIVEDKNGQLWISTNNGLNRLNSQQKQFERFYIPNSKNDITSIEFDGKNTIWVVTRGGDLCSFDITTKKFLKKELVSSHLSKNNVKRLFLDTSGILWIASETNGLFSFDPSANVFETYSAFGKKLATSGFSIKDIIQIDSTHLMLAVDQVGIDVLDVTTRKIVSVTGENIGGNGLNNYGIWTIMKDKEGILWVGTSAGGVNIANPKRNKFKLYRHNPSNSNSLCYNAILCMFEDSKGLIWIGSDGGGLSVLDPSREQFTNYTFRSTDTRSISGNVIGSITEDRNSDIWLTTWDAGINRFDRKTKTFRRFYAEKNKKNGLSSNNYWSSVTDKNGDIWLSVFNDGVEVFDVNRGVLNRYSLGENYKSTDNPYLFAFLFKTKSNDIFACQNDNILKFDSVNNSFKKFSTIRNDIFWTVCEDRKGNIWIGTEKSGILELKPNGELIRKFEVADENGPSRVNSIIEDDRANLWISTDNGLYKFNPETKEKTKFTVADGLQGNVFWRNSSLKTQNGTLYFGGFNGFNSFHPDSLSNNTYQPQVFINEFTIFNKPVYAGTKNSVLYRVINLTNEIVLSYKQSIFSFSFSASNYTHSDNCKFAYKMEGFDKDWAYTDAYRRYASYTNLDPGEYVFYVKASNNDGLWSKHVKTIRITIIPPFWRTKWFLVLVIILLIASVSFWINFRLYRIKRQKIILKKLVEARTEELSQLIKGKDKFISIMAHDLKNPLGGVIGLINLLKGEYNDLLDAEKRDIIDIISRSSEHLKKLLENLLLWLRSSTGSLPFKPIQINLFDLVENNIGLLSANARQKNVIINNYIENGIEITADKEQITLVFRNILSNAIKYCFENGQVTIRSMLSKNEIAICIEDNGTGMSKEQLASIFSIENRQSIPGTKNEKGTGLGLILCYESIKAHSGRISLESEVGKGTKVFFYLPHNV